MRGLFCDRVATHRTEGEWETVYVLCFYSSHSQKLYLHWFIVLNGNETVRVGLLVQARGIFNPLAAAIARNTNSSELF